MEKRFKILMFVNVIVIILAITILVQNHLLGLTHNKRSLAAPDQSSVDVSNGAKSPASSDTLKMASVNIDQDSQNKDGSSVEKDQSAHTLRETGLTSEIKEAIDASLPGSEALSEEGSRREIERVHLKGHPKMQPGVEVSPPEEDIAFLKAFEEQELQAKQLQDTN